MAPAMMWSEAIVRRRCVSATDDGMDAAPAPRVFYIGVGQPCAATATVTRRGRGIVKPLLGIVVVAGPRGSFPTHTPLEIDPSYAPDDPRFADTTLLAVELELA